MLLYALTTVVSAFLLFQVQPIIAKIILPWFGGSAAVWTVCLLFFQLVLLLGYTYAHVLVRYFERQVQTMIHAGLLLVSGFLFLRTIYPPASMKPLPGADPTVGILALLAATVGLPYFLLSTTGPLLQAWYARQHHSKMPYRLYALSNAGSMFALLSYPWPVERYLTLHQQSLTWSVAYGAFMLLCGFTALRSGAEEAAAAVEAQAPAPKPTARQYALWVLPLSLYLLSFILCFEGSGWYRRNPYLQLLAVALGGMAYGLTVDTTGNMPIWWMLMLFGLGLFTCCMVLHGELVRLKPDPQYLTHFYLTISAGGALGGVFVGLIAPRVFRSFYEMPLGLVLCAVLVLLALSLDAEAAPWFSGWRSILPGAGAALTVAMALYLGIQIREQARDARLMVRNFYGALKVHDTGPETNMLAVRTLTHGTINHGEEYLNIARRRLPTTYYGPNTGVGIAIREKQKQGSMRVGVIGLGTGTIAAYGRLGDYYRYYEINPLVPPITKGQFYFVPECPAKLDIAMGDARLSLEREAPGNFDVLAVDAFSSDAIAVHLLTKEAMQLYFRHLRPDGVLAVHISNRYLDLQPVVEGEAQALGKLARVVDTDDDETQDIFGATWVLVTSPATGFDDVETKNSAEIESKKKVRLWTDDYSNLFQILK